MMMLGRMLNELARTSDESVVLEFLPDLVLLARARAAAVATGISLNQYAVGACRAFLDRADEEEWASFMSRLREGAEPGATLVTIAVQRRLDGHRCGCGRVDHRHERRAAGGRDR
jgi:hypothetical protein